MSGNLKRERERERERERQRQRGRETEPERERQTDRELDISNSKRSTIFTVSYRGIYPHQKQILKRYINLKTYIIRCKSTFSTIVRHIKRSSYSKIHFSIQLLHEHHHSNRIA